MIETQETGVVEVCPPPAPHSSRERNGKIARLPLAIRTELNHRMRDGKPGAELVAWLNSLPEVQQVMKDQFDGLELTACNLSRWREGGHQDYLAEQLVTKGATDLVKDAAAIKGFPLNDLAQNMALVTVARLGVELRRIGLMQDDEARFKCLRDIIWAVIFLRRGEAETERLKRDQRKKEGYLLSEEELEKQVWLWASDPEHKESLRRRLFMSEEEKQAAAEEILSSDSKFLLADEEYIKSIGGKLGARLPEEFVKAMEEAKAKRKEEERQEAPPAPKPEQPPPWAAKR